MSVFTCLNGTAEGRAATGSRQESKKAQEDNWHRALSRLIRYRGQQKHSRSYVIVPNLHT
jgi:hypothetical protein